MYCILLIPKCCSLFAQVVFAKTSEVGCGVEFCDSLTETKREDGKVVIVERAAKAVFVACDYRVP